jgi:hypothetical protein
VEHEVLKDTFDPITGEVVSLPIEANYYDSSADTRQIQYPHIFVKLLRMREDLTTGRVIPQYGRQITLPVQTSPKAFEQILYSSDGAITAPGNTFGTGIFKIKKVQAGYLLRVLSGNNIGTYKITSITASNVGNHTITVSPDLVENLPEIGFVAATRTVTFLTQLDISTVKIGDTFVDDSNTSWNITAVDADKASIEIGGTLTPDLAAGGKITRSGNVFQTTDPTLVKFSILDPSKPIIRAGGCAATSTMQTVNPSIPIDLYYLVRIDSKERSTHIDIANRMWEEFNPPRTALPTIVRSKLSADQQLTEDVTTGGSDTLKVKDNFNYNVGDTAFVFDELTPTKAANGDGFQEVFTAQIISKSGTDTIQLSKPVPDTFLVENGARVVSNAEYRLHMFHFVDHVTKDVEAAQYWSHEFTFWVQVFVDRQGAPVDTDGVIQKIEISGDDIDGNVIFEC